MFHDLAGRPAALDTLRRWSGKALDPDVAAIVLRDPVPFFESVETEDAWGSLLGTEPAPHRTIVEWRVDEVAAAFADAVDLKSPYLQGHSAGVADLAARAGETAGLDGQVVSRLRRAGSLHDLGRAAVPTGVWEKPGPLSVGEWEQVRLHAYHSERILSRSAVLEPLARLAGMHHERLDGSGYHRGAPPSMQDTDVRILAAVDAYHALTEARPHRGALAPDRAASALQSMPLDHDAVQAVLTAAGVAPTRSRRAWPNGLTEREVEILRLLARGDTKRRIAEALHVSHSTVHTHTVHVYEKLGISTRAAAAMFAMEHDLLRL